MTKYKDFVKSTGYGTGGGLSGWNCRHFYFFSFVSYRFVRKNLKNFFELRMCRILTFYFIYCTIKYVNITKENKYKTAVV